MAQQRGESKQVVRQEMHGVERLGLRVSSMINHPISQAHRWVIIHRLDTDGEREWEEVMGVLSETDDLEMIFNEDETVTLRWEDMAGDDRPPEPVDVDAIGDAAPF